jgi:hypothetical protein
MELAYEKGFLSVDFKKRCSALYLSIKEYGIIQGKPDYGT